MLADQREKAAAAQAKAREDAERTKALAAQTAEADARLAATEAHISAVKAEIENLSHRQDALQADVTRLEAALRPILPLAERLSMTPATTLIASPVRPDQAVQGLAIVNGLAMLTERRSDKLRTKQQELAETAAALALRRKDLDALHDTQATERDIAARQTAAAQKTEDKAIHAAQSAQAAVAEAASKATDLQDAIAQIEKAETAAQAQLAAQAKALAARHRHHAAHRAAREAASLASSGAGVSHGDGKGPVAGTVKVAWGQTTEAGPSTGMTYAAPGNAAVSAPCSGRIEFAGPFRSFGQMMILNCGHHYRFVLAGLGALKVHNGQSVHKHATLGTMPSAGGALLVQLRKGSSTVDPRPFL